MLRGKFCDVYPCRVSLYKKVRAVPALRESIAAAAWEPKPSCPRALAANPHAEGPRGRGFWVKSADSLGLGKIRPAKTDAFEGQA